MMHLFDWVLLGTFLLTSALAVYVTIRDKAAAKRNSHRTPEASLLLLGLIGGALAEFITMLIIRHKTKHPKFMLGLPAIILLHVILAYLYFAWLRKSLI